jgi:hypothetical protein
MSGTSNMRPVGRMSSVALMTIQMWPIWPSGDLQFDMPGLHYISNLKKHENVSYIGCSLCCHLTPYMYLCYRSSQPCMKVLGDKIGNIPNEKMERYLTFYTVISSCETWNGKFKFSWFTVYQKQGTSLKTRLQMTANLTAFLILWVKWKCDMKYECAMQSILYGI